MFQSVFLSNKAISAVMSNNLAIRCNYMPSFKHSYYFPIKLIVLTTEHFLKELAHVGLAKKKKKKKKKPFFLQSFFVLIVLGTIFFCSINFCFGPFERHQFTTNCCGLKIDWGSPTAERGAGIYGMRNTSLGT